MFRVASSCAGIAVFDCAMDAGRCHAQEETGHAECDYRQNRDLKLFAEFVLQLFDFEAELFQLIAVEINQSGDGQAITSLEVPYRVD